MPVCSATLGTGKEDQRRNLRAQRKARGRPAWPELSAAQRNYNNRVQIRRTRVVNGFGSDAYVQQQLLRTAPSYRNSYPRAPFESMTAVCLPPDCYAHRDSGKSKTRIAIGFVRPAIVRRRAAIWAAAANARFLSRVRVETTSRAHRSAPARSTIRRRSCRCCRAS